MNKAVRQRVWSVLEKWCMPELDMSVLMTWPDNALPGGQAVAVVGGPKTDIVDYDGIFLSRRDVSEKTTETDENQTVPF
jgi:CRISPR-associated endoribonuclease Cas2 subtype I-E